MPSLRKDATRLQAENQKLIPMRADFDALSAKSCMRPDIDKLFHKHVVCGNNRRALEFEKKAHEEQAEQKDAVEKNLISMARELEKL
ncbi:hypothetical protein SAY87_012917 [Trapa incisa]|uniref:Uncharacterized protein n=1 Tax=Trapa incisa TaxID=236973 RepID=A0AAN7KAQ5_9MYRT|nr:hypothetical protein SAY87_012917 [Trapa incisa]